MEKEQDGLNVDQSESDLLTTLKLLANLSDDEHLQYLEEYKVAPNESRLCKAIQQTKMPNKSGWDDIVAFLPEFTFSKIYELTSYFMIILNKEDKNLLYKFIDCYEKKAVEEPIDLEEDLNTQNRYVNIFDKAFKLLSKANLKENLAYFNPQFCIGFNVLAEQAHTELVIFGYLKEKQKEFPMLHPTTKRLSTRETQKFLPGPKRSLTTYIKKYSDFNMFPEVIFKYTTPGSTKYSDIVHYTFKIWVDYYKRDSSRFKSYLKVLFEDLDSIPPGICLFGVCKKWLGETFDQDDALPSLIFNALDQFDGVKDEFKFYQFLTSFFDPSELRNGEESTSSGGEDQFQLQIYIFTKVLISSYPKWSELLNTFLKPKKNYLNVWDGKKSNLKTAISRSLSRKLDEVGCSKKFFKRYLDFLMQLEGETGWIFYLSLFRVQATTPDELTSRLNIIDQVSQKLGSNPTKSVFHRENVLSILYTDKSSLRKRISHMFGVYLYHSKLVFEHMPPEGACDLIKVIDKSNLNYEFQTELIATFLSFPDFFNKVISSALKSNARSQSRGKSLDGPDRDYLITVFDKLEFNRLIGKLLLFWSAQKLDVWPLSFKLASLYSTSHPSYSSVYLCLCDHILELEFVTAPGSDDDSHDIKNAIQKELKKVVESLIKAGQVSGPPFYKLFETLKRIEEEAVDSIHIDFEKALTSFQVQLSMLVHGTGPSLHNLSKIYAKMCPFVDFIANVFEECIKAESLDDSKIGISFQSIELSDAANPLASRLVPKLFLSSAFHQTLLILCEFIAYTATPKFTPELPTEFNSLEAKLLANLLRLLQFLLGYINIELNSDHRHIQRLYLNPSSEKFDLDFPNLKDSFNIRFQDSLGLGFEIQTHASKLLTQLQGFSPNSIYIPFFTKLAQS